MSNYRCHLLIVVMNLIPQSNLLQKQRPARVGMQRFQEHRHFRQRYAGVAEFVGALEPFKGFVRFPTKGMYVGDLDTPLFTLTDKSGKSAIRFGRSAEGMIDDCKGTLAVPG